jgi:small subunit ribosomal protein S20
LAHSKSALKRWRQSLTRRDRNRSAKSKTRTLLNKAISTVGQEGSEDAVKAAVSALDRAAQDGVIHKNAAARSKSRLLKRFNLATASAVANAAGAAEEAPKRAAAKPVAKKPAARTTRAKAEPKAADKPARGRTKKS